jgi:hypothetical protein
MDFRELVDLVPPGATFTMVSDSCHSGGLIDQEKEQIGPNVPADHGDIHAGGRFLPYAAVLGHLSAASGLDASPSHHHGTTSPTTCSRSSAPTPAPSTATTTTAAATAEAAHAPPTMPMPGSC